MNSNSPSRSSASPCPGPIKVLAAVALTASLAVMQGGCYLAESAAGQLSLMAKREPIARVIDDPRTPPLLRARLEEVRSIREFATRQLGLPDNGSYRSYVDLHRPYVVWKVVAAPEFSVDAKEWCYPIVGCVAYRGYFVERRARDFAAGLRARGFDVHVGGVAAYSTLGHFDDPVQNTMMGWSDVELAAIIFHELTHQLLYVAGDASFNEALATAVEEEGVRRWLVAAGRERDLEAHREEVRQEAQLVQRSRRTRSELRALYASGADVATMRSGKNALLAELRQSYATLHAGRVDPEINNAYLASLGTYYDCIAGFDRELAATQGNLSSFYRRVRQLASLPQAARDAAVCSG